MRQVAVPALIIAVGLLALLPVGCNSKRVPPDSRVLRAFSDFVYVGSTPYRVPAKGEGIDPRVVFEGGRPQSVPEQLQVGTVYIFRHKPPFDDEKFALSELPARLRRANLQVVQAPGSIRDLILPYFGPPLFIIRFSAGTHSGFIANQMSPDYQKEVDSGWTGENYILAYTQ